MRLDPQECRLYALTCERLAVRSKATLEKDAYADLANKWLKLAGDLEKLQAVARAESESRRRTG
jgi:hypothetical protein